MGCRAELLKPVEIPQVQFSDKVYIGSYATLGEIIETSWLRSQGVWRSQCSQSGFVGCCAELLQPVEFHRCSSWTRLSSCPLS